MKLNEQTLTAVMNNWLVEQEYEAFPPEVGTKGQRKSELIFTIGEDRFVIEVEIGRGYDKLLEGMAQASKYREDLQRQGLDVKGTITIVYPSHVRQSVQSEAEAREQAQEILQNERITQGMVLPPLLDIKQDLTFPALIKKIAEAVAENELSIETIVDTLRSSVDELARRLEGSVQQDDAMLDDLIQNVELFRILATEEGDVDQNEIPSILCRLSAYVLINQLIFYHLLSKSLREQGDFSLPELTAHDDIGDISEAFNAIQDIDYEPIYAIEIIDRLPNHVQNLVTEVIRVIRSVQLEEVQQDLLGQIYHNLIPHETRKKLAAFFTNPKAAALLSELLIDSKDTTVLDPACGSGTLLTAAYHTKMERATGGLQVDNNIKARHHQQFTGHDLTGIDLMPFSAHMTAMNLAIQAPYTKTDTVRIGVDDSLRLLPEQQAGAIMGDLSPLVPGSGRGTVDLGNGRSSFTLSTVDAIIMNPPFTRKRRLNRTMQAPAERWNYDQFGRLHYWSYFTMHANRYVEGNGKIGAVLPLGFLALQDGQHVRRYLADKGFELKYVVKSMRDIAFSDSAAFRDYLLVLERSNGHSDPATGFVYLKDKLEDVTPTQVRTMAHEIRQSEGQDSSTEQYDLVWVKGRLDVDNLWENLEINDPYGRPIKPLFNELIYQNVNMTTLQDLLGDEEPTYFSPQALRGNVRHATFISGSDRTRTLLRLQEDDDKYLIVSPKDSDLTYRIPKANVLPAMKSPYYKSKINADDYGYVVKSRYKGFEDVERFANASVDFQSFGDEIDRIQGKLAIARRFDLSAPGLRLLAFHSQAPLVTTENLWSIPVTDNQSSKVLSLYFNSSFSLMETVFSKRKETRASFSQFDKYKLAKMHVPNLKAISKRHFKTLASMYDEICEHEFPSILKQFEDADDRRQELDDRFADALEITYTPHHLHTSLSKKLRNLKSLQ